MNPEVLRMSPGAIILFLSVKYGASKQPNALSRTLSTGPTSKSDNNSSSCTATHVQPASPISNTMPTEQTAFILDGSMPASYLGDSGDEDDAAKCAAAWAAKNISATSFLPGAAAGDSSSSSASTAIPAREDPMYPVKTGVWIFSLSKGIIVLVTMEFASGQQIVLAAFYPLPVADAKVAMPQPQNRPAKKIRKLAALFLTDELSGYEFLVKAGDLDVSEIEELLDLIRGKTVDAGTKLTSYQKETLSELEEHLENKRAKYDDFDRDFYQEGEGE